MTVLGHEGHVMWDADGVPYRCDTCGVDLPEPTERMTLIPDLHDADLAVDLSLRTEFGSHE